MKAQELINEINKAPAGVEIEGGTTCDGDMALFYRTGKPYPEEIEIIVSLESTILDL